MAGPVINGQGRPDTYCALKGKWPRKNYGTEFRLPPSGYRISQPHCTFVLPSFEPYCCLILPQSGGKKSMMKVIHIPLHVFSRRSNEMAFDEWTLQP